MTRLYITDLDGTLLDSTSHVTDRSAAIITELSHEGALISVATARTPATVEPLLAHTYTTIPAVVMTGAALWDRSRQRFMHIRYLSPDTVRAIESTLHALAIYPFYYSVNLESPMVDCYHFGPRMSTQEESFINERQHRALKRVHIEPCGAIPAYKRPMITQLFAIGELEAIKHAAGIIRSSIDCSLMCYPDVLNPSVGFIEVFAPGVSKASAIRKLKDMVGADTLTVFGDNLNDLPMMAIADEAVAVGNALEDVKQRATTIIGPNTADSVAQYIKQRFRN